MRKKYTGSFRTTISEEDYRRLKALANRKGYTLSGYIDRLCLESIRREEANDDRKKTVSDRT